MPHFPKPFYKKSRKTWYVEINGRQINLGRDEEQAFQRYHQMMMEPHTAPAPATPSIGLVELVDSFLDWVKLHRSPDTYRWYLDLLQRICKRYPSMIVSTMRPYHVQKWVDSYPRLSKNSRRNHFRSIKRCMNWALKQGYIDTNPIANLEMPGAERREGLVAQDEYERLLSFVDDPDFRDLIVTTWETGCRPQESLRVEARHVDLDHQRWVFPSAESKGKRQPRVVYLTEVAMEITRRRLANHGKGHLFRNSRGNPWTTESVKCAFDRVRLRMYRHQIGTKKPTFPEEEIRAVALNVPKSKTVKGQKMSRTAAERKYEAIRILTAKQASSLVPRYSLYALRHAWATRALQSGLDGLTVAILMGHSDPSTLARVYQHLAHQPDHLLAQARRVVGSSLSRVGATLEDYSI